MIFIVLCHVVLYFVYTFMTMSKFKFNKMSARRIQETGIPVLNVES